MICSMMVCPWGCSPRGLQPRDVQALTQQRKVPIRAGCAAGLPGAPGWCVWCIAGFCCEQSWLEAPILGRCWGRSELGGDLVPFSKWHYPV